MARVLEPRAGICGKPLVYQAQWMALKANKVQIDLRQNLLGRRKGVNYRGLLSWIKRDLDGQFVFLSNQKVKRGYF